MGGSSPRMTCRIGRKGMSMEVNGIAHIFLTASNFERSREFYRKLLRFLGPKPDELHGFLCSLGVTIIRAPREDQWAPGYYSLPFEDPDGIRLELNHVPGKGLLS